MFNLPDFTLAGRLKKNGVAVSAATWIQSVENVLPNFAVDPLVLADHPKKVSGLVAIKPDGSAPYCFSCVLMQFLLIMDKVFPKLNESQFKRILERLFYVDSSVQTQSNNTNRSVNSRKRLLDTVTGHTKSDFMSVLVRYTMFYHRFITVYPVDVESMCCRLYAPSSLLDVVLVIISLKTCMIT